MKTRIRSDIGHKNKRWRGIGSLSKTYFNSIKNSAIFRKIEFDITIEQAWDLFIQQDKKCALSGMPIELIESVRISKKNKTRQTASLDRIDSSRGYFIDNIQWIHVDINLMKNVYSEDYFIKMCKLIRDNANG